MTNRWIPCAMTFVRRNLLLILLVAGVGACFGLLRALTTPNQYRSVGKLLLRPGMREVSKPESAISGDDTQAARSSSGEAIQNEMQVLASPILFAKVVERVGAEQVLAPYDPASRGDGSETWFESKVHAFQSWWFQSTDKRASADLGLDAKSLARNMLAESIDMYPEAGTNVISVAYVSHSPDLAQEVVNATLDAAIAIHDEVFHARSSLDAIEADAQMAEQTARTAERTLRTFLRENSIYDHDVQRSGILDDLSAMDRQIRNTKENGQLDKQEQLAVARAALVDELAAFDAKIPNLHRLELDAMQKRTLASRLKEGVTSMQAAQRLTQSNIAVMQVGTLEPIQIAPAPGKRVLTAGLVGALAGTMLALLLAWRTRRVRRRHDLAALGVPL